MMVRAAPVPTSTTEQGGVLLYSPPGAQRRCHHRHSQRLKGAQASNPQEPQKGLLRARPVPPLGTHLSTWSVMYRSTERAFREISNSIASACFCSSCGGASTDSGFQAPFPRSYEEAACWLHISNHGLGRKPKPHGTNSGSHLDCSSAASLPEQGQERLQLIPHLPARYRPQEVLEVPGVPPPGRGQSRTAALSLPGITSWPGRDTRGCRRGELHHHEDEEENLGPGTATVPI